MRKWDTRYLYFIQKRRNHGKQKNCFNCYISVCCNYLNWMCLNSKKPEIEGVVFQKQIEVVQKAAVDALVVLGFDVKKTEPTYVEGSRPRKIGLFVGSGGETVGIWLESLEPEKTVVRVIVTLLSL
ncbi:MAG: hypothetical protein Q8P40_04440 [Nitrospirota bacterium]|nr:hypothetical protein [Nitrospirota bacterium]